MDDITWFALVLIVGAMMFQFTRPDGISSFSGWLEKRSLPIITVLFAGFLLCIQWIAPSGTAPFIYFQF